MVLFLGIGMWRFHCVAFVFESFVWIACHVILFDKQRHLAGNFRGVSGRLCWIFKFCLDFLLSIRWCVVTVLRGVIIHVLLVDAVFII